MRPRYFASIFEYEIVEVLNREKHSISPYQVSLGISVLQCSVAAARSVYSKWKSAVKWVRLGLWKLAPGLWWKFSSVRSDLPLQLEMAHAVQKVVERCEAAEENGGLMGENFLNQLFHSSVKSGEFCCCN